MTLVTCPQAGHSKAINPGSPASGAIVTTSFIVDPHFAHEGASASAIFSAPLLFIDSVFVTMARSRSPGLLQHLRVLEVTAYLRIGSQRSGIGFARCSQPS